MFENGVLKPEGPVDLPEGARGIAHIRTTIDAGKDDAGERSAWAKAQEAALAGAWDDDEDAVYDNM